MHFANQEDWLREQRRHFHEGTAAHCYRWLGCHYAGDGGYVFRVWAPNARAVSLVGDFNDWDATAYLIDRLEDGVREKGYDFNYPVYTRRLSCGAGNLPTCQSFLWTDAGNIVIETVKKAEDSSKLVVRMYEADNSRTTCVLHSTLSISACVESDLMENPENVLSVIDNAITLDFRPFEIKTVLLDIVK